MPSSSISLQAISSIYLNTMVQFSIARDISPLYEVWKLDPHWVAHLADPDGLQHASVAELVQHHNILERHRCFLGVGLDTSHEERVAPGVERVKIITKNYISMLCQVLRRNKTKSLYAG